MYAILFVLDDPQHLDAILSAWSDIGVRGVTVMESTGWQQRKFRQGLPGSRFNFAALSMASLMKNHMTLFVVVKNRTIVQTVLQTAETIVGDLDKANTGIFVAWQVEIIKGLPLDKGEEN